MSENAQEISVLDALNYFKATKDEKPVTRISNHHKHVEKALTKFRTIQDEEIRIQETSQKDLSNLGAQVSTAINLLNNFMNEIGDNDLYIKVAHLKTLVERGVITYIAKRLQRIQKNLRRTGGKARMTHDEPQRNHHNGAKVCPLLYCRRNNVESTRNRRRNYTFRKFPINQISNNELQRDIESKYNRESWQQLLHDIFLNKVTFHNSPGKVHVNGHLAKEALNLGYIKLSDGLTIAIYEVELSDNVDIERNRRGIRDMLTTDWRTNHAGAFMFCYRKNESILRFSYVSETWGFNKQGEYEKISTDTKRYTYLLGEGRGCHTAIKQFGKLKESKQALTDITEAFSVETLTKQFYKDLFEWYQWAIDDSTQVPSLIT